MQYKIVKLLSFVVGFEAFLVIAGWVFSIDSLTRVGWPAGVNMKFPTALMFFFAAWGLYFLTQLIARDDRRARTILLYMALCVFITMNLLLVADIFSLTTDLEKLFIIEHTPYLGEGSPAIATVISFILFGLALLFYVLKGSGFYSRLKYFGYPIFVLGLLPVFGYLFDFNLLYYQFTEQMTPMAFNTGLSFLLLGLGLILLSRTNNYQA